ncbi:hypothetical protein FTO70_16455 [Methanosarcina sp. KYL-1]|uniref:hypothetical protein n=1 Tax=Methanosarcina sp. KYL-1 TaxID=2602068 RepID=UPI002100F0E4|nr:hypothetical protein [Methanosarcina sp. KYL-1]MCQ1537234.1 hypothetical protein [Methanosarcina sp. KYL-1]
MKLNQIDDTRRKRAILIFIATVIFISFKGFMSPVTEVGYILQKDVMGVEGDEKVLIFREGPEGVSALNVSCGQIFPEGSENLQVNESVEAELKTVYPEIEYMVLMRLCVENEVREYRVHREDFNMLEIGKVAKFEVYRSERDFIKEIIEM